MTRGEGTAIGSVGPPFMNGLLQTISHTEGNGQGDRGIYHQPLPRRGTLHAAHLEHIGRRHGHKAQIVVDAVAMKLLLRLHRQGSQQEQQTTDKAFHDAKIQKRFLSTKKTAPAKSGKRASGDNEPEQREHLTGFLPTSGNDITRC